MPSRTSRDATYTLRAQGGGSTRFIPISDLQYLMVELSASPGVPYTAALGLKSP